MLPSILLVCTIAVLGWAVFMYLLKPINELSFVQTPVRSFSYFFFLTLLILTLFYPITGKLFSDVSLSSFVFAWVVIGVLNPWAYRFVRYEYSHTLHTLPLHTDLELLRIDPRFLFSKLGDVVFQQTVFGTLVLLLAIAHIPLPLIALLGAVAFSLGHFGLFFRIPHEWALYFIFSAGIGGALLPLLILFVPGGFYFALALHMFWYVCTGAFYVAQEARRHPHHHE